MQPCGNGKNPTFGPNLGFPKFLPRVLPLPVIRQCPKLSSYAICWKTNQTWEHGKKPNFQPDYGVLTQIWSPKSFLWVLPKHYMLHIVASYHCMHFQGKLINQSWENGKKPIFGPHFVPVDQNLGPKPNFFSLILPLLK